MKYTIDLARDSDLASIKSLQESSHYANVSETEKETEGFVSVETGIPMLRMINSELGIIVAREGPEIVGYEMPLGLGHARGLPILDPFISRILKLEYKGKALSKYRVVIEGQICVKKGHKGKGVAERLHAAFLERMRGKFDLVVTEISDQNPRSLHVHTMKLGMKVIDTYRAEGRNWQVLLHDLAG